jgi:hypothetical protein
MKQTLLGGLCCIAALWCTQPLVCAEPDVEIDRPSTDKTVPNFSLLDYRGRHYEPYRTNSRIVVLYFTGVGCPLARQSVPKLLKMRTQFGPRGVTFWMINSAPQNDYNEPTLKIIAQMGLNDKLSAFVPNDEEGREAIARLKSMAKLNGVQSESQLIGDPETFKLQVLEGSLGSLTLLRDENQLIAHHFGATNSESNPSNPDAGKTVRFGLQTSDEMFMGFMTAADLPDSKN